MNKLFLLFFIFPLSVHAKSYEVTLSPCDIGTNCKKCYEVIKLTYSVEVKSKQIYVSGKDSSGKDIKEPIEENQDAKLN